MQPSAKPAPISHRVTEPFIVSLIPQVDLSCRRLTWHERCNTGDSGAAELADRQSNALDIAPNCFKETNVLAPTVPSDVINPHWLERALDQTYRIERLLVRTKWMHEFEGVHALLGRKVSICVLRRAYCRDDEVRRRFARAIKTRASLYNAHVPSTLATGVLETGQPYVVTELISGTPLLDWVTARGGRLSWQEASSFTFQLCSPIADLHALRLVSRGVLPEAVWITQYPGLKPMVKLSDFRHASTDCQVPQSHPISLASVRPTYQAPEARAGAGEPIDCRTDVWALGCLLFEMLVGRPLPR